MKQNKHGLLKLLGVAAFLTASGIIFPRLALTSEVVNNPSLDGNFTEQFYTPKIGQTVPNDNYYESYKKRRNQLRQSLREIAWYDQFKDRSDITLLADVIFGEAENCSGKEKEAVALTVLNRAHDGNSWDGETIKEAILVPYQYSSFNMGEKRVIDPMLEDSKGYMEDLRIAANVLCGRVKDFTGGATNFYLKGTKKPAWASSSYFEKVNSSITKGFRHQFYRPSKSNAA